jgi:hypothetical protein
MLFESTEIFSDKYYAYIRYDHSKFLDFFHCLESTIKNLFTLDNLSPNNKKLKVQIPILKVSCLAKDSEKLWQYL